ncbi:MAG: hypothetical protein QXH24_04510 [Candidatus Bathyarchaeia archaeon]
MESIICSNLEPLGSWWEMRAKWKKKRMRREKRKRKKRRERYK